MHLEKRRRRAGGCRPRHAAQGPLLCIRRQLPQRRGKARGNVGPRAHVLWLLLNPVQLGIWVLAAHHCHAHCRKRRHLLQAMQHHGTFKAARCTGVMQIVEHLPAAKDQPSAALGRDRCAHVVATAAFLDETLKACARHHVLQG